MPTKQRNLPDLPPQGNKRHKRNEGQMEQRRDEGVGQPLGHHWPVNSEGFIERKQNPDRRDNRPLNSREKPADVKYSEGVNPPQKEIVKIERRKVQDNEESAFNNQQGFILQEKDQIGFGDPYIKANKKQTNSKMGKTSLPGNTNKLILNPSSSVTSQSNINIKNPLPDMVDKQFQPLIGSNQFSRNNQAMNSLQTNSNQTINSPTSRVNLEETEILSTLNSRHRVQQQKQDTITGKVGSSDQVSFVRKWETEKSDRLKAVSEDWLSVFAEWQETEQSWCSGKMTGYFNEFVHLQVRM